MCTPKIISSFAPKIRIIIIKTSVTFLLVNRLSVCTRQTDCQLSVHNNIMNKQKSCHIGSCQDIIELCDIRDGLALCDTLSNDEVCKLIDIICLE